MLLSGWKIFRRCPDFTLRLLAGAIICNIIVQALINLAVNTALAPTKGIALPMISHGSSGLTMTLLQVGILIAIARVSEREMAEFERTVEAAEGAG